MVVFCRSQSRDIERKESLWMAELGVNIDHVATVRASSPDRTSPTPSGRPCWPSWAGPTASRSTCAKTAGTSRTATCACCAKRCTVKLNLELAVRRRNRWRSPAKFGRDQATLVPERREEVTTEGGLDVVGNRDAVAEAVATAARRGHRREPVPRSRSDADRSRAPSWASTPSNCTPANTPMRAGETNCKHAELATLVAAAGRVALEPGLHAARGPRPDLSQREADRRHRRHGELNIGHSIVARAIMVGIRAGGARNEGPDERLIEDKPAPYAGRERPAMRRQQLRRGGCVRMRGISVNAGDLSSSRAGHWECTSTSLWECREAVRARRRKMLAHDFDIVHISVGDIFRWHIQTRTKLGSKIKRIVDSGQLVTDEIVEEVVRRRLAEHRLDGRLHSRRVSPERSEGPVLARSIPARRRHPHQNCRPNRRQADAGQAALQRLRPRLQPRYRRRSRTESATIAAESWRPVPTTTKRPLANDSPTITR